MTLDILRAIVVRVGLRYVHTLIFCFLTSCNAFIGRLNPCYKCDGFGFFNRIFLTESIENEYWKRIPTRHDANTDENALFISFRIDAVSLKIEDFLFYLLECKLNQWVVFGVLTYKAAEPVLISLADRTRILETIILRLASVKTGNFFACRSYKSFSV